MVFVQNINVYWSELRKLAALHSQFFFHWTSDSEEKAMATHFSTLAWKIPWMEEPGRLQSLGSLRVGHDWMTSLSLFTFMHWRRKWQPYPVFLPAESQGWQSLVGCRVYGVAQSQTWLKQLSSSSSSDSEAMLRQEWLFFLTYAWFGFIQMWVWFENYRLACIYRKKLLTLFQFMWEPNMTVQAKVHWNAQHKLNTVAVLSHFSHVWLFETLWTVARQAPWSMGFSRQEYWSGLPCSPPGESSRHRDRTHVSYVCLHWQRVLSSRCRSNYSDGAELNLSSQMPTLCLLGSLEDRRGP